MAVSGNLQGVWTDFVYRSEILRQNLLAESTAAVQNAIGLGWKELQERNPAFDHIGSLVRYETEALELSKTLPDAGSFRGRKFIESVGLTYAPGWLDGLIGTNPLQAKFNLREVVTDFHREDILQRAVVDGKLQAALANILLARRDDLPISEEHQQAHQQALAAYEQWSAGVSARLAQTLAREGHYTKSGRAWNAKERAKNLEFWSRQQRAVQSALALEMGQRNLRTAILESNHRLVSSLMDEKRLISESAAELANYIHNWEPGQPFQPPVSLAGLRSLEDWVHLWRSRVEADIQELLPDPADAVAPRALPSPLRTPWRLLHPRAVWREALVSTLLPGLSDTVAAMVTGNLSRAQEIERARAVVEYGIQVGGDYLHEAQTNALALIGQPSSLEQEAAERMLADLQSVLVTAQREVQVGLEISVPGWLVTRSRRQGLQWNSVVRLKGKRAIREGARRLQLGAAAGTDWALQRIGWRPPLRVPLPPVELRPGFAEALKRDAHEIDLPGIYKRLFSLAPIDDARFLVGRESEMSGLAQALSSWEAGHFAAVLLVGARGSGKTSLLNCAQNAIFTGRRVIRGQFHDRLTTASAVDEFLAGFIPPDNSAQRKIVILEEFERCFLRAPGGLCAVQRLLEIVQASAQTTLWIFALNLHSLRYLSRAMELDRFFTHRINAMSLRISDLRAAILQRHNLSGLRLKFTPPPAGDPRLTWLRRTLGLERDPETLYFESLFEQSGGVFRSAFQLWQNSVHRVEGGVIEMAQPLNPDYSRLKSALGQQDHFILLAVFQHGSLLSEELARILQTPVASAARGLDRLYAMGLLQLDPEHPGFRISPEARQFAQDALHRVNLV